MRIFVTGGTSFIGAHVVKALLDAGHELTVLARDPHKVDGLCGCAGLTLLQGLMSDYEIVEQALEGAQVVVNIAHIPGEGAVGKILADAVPTCRLLELSAAAGVEQFIFTSSTSALGELSVTMPENRICLPNAWWGACKAAIEKFVLAASWETPMRCNCIRPALTFGAPAVAGAPTEAYSRFRDIVAAAQKGEDIILAPGDGTQMTSAHDLAQVYRGCVVADYNRRIYHGVVPVRTLWQEYAQCAIRLLDSPSRIIINTELSESFDCLYGAQQIKQDFGLEFSPWPALQMHIEWILENGAL